MSYSQEFSTKLSKGAVMLRKAWPNTNSSKNQISVQVMQEIQSSLGNNGSEAAVVALTQGASPTQKVTAILSFDKDVIEQNLSREIDAVVTFHEEDDQVINSGVLFGGLAEIDIQVTENTEPNPYAKQQNPKINPSTQEVLLFEGKEIYRHTTCVLKGTAKHTFLQPSTIDPAKEMLSKATAAGMTEGVTVG
jgi:hypothetical protein